MKSSILYLLLSLFLLIGCSKEDDNILETDTPVPNKPAIVVDVVASKYNGRVIVLSDSNELMSYLYKRFVNTSQELAANAEVIILDESNVAKITSDSAKMDIVSSLWYKNKAFAFVNPGINALNFVAKLRATMSGQTYKALPDDVAASFANAHIYITKADGNEMIYNRISKQHKHHSTIVKTSNKEGAEADVSSSDRESDISYVPSDYEVGRIAERASEWCNANITSSETAQSVMFRSDADDPFAGNRVVRTIYTAITVSHSLCYDHYWCTLDEIPPMSTTEAMVRINAIAGYSETIDSDIYDLVLTQEFNAANTHLANYLIHEHLAYNWRYSGGYYYGPTVNISIDGGEGSSFSFYDNTDIYAPAPTPTADSYTVTHNPATTSFNGGVIGGASLSSSGLSGSLSGSFGFSFTLPSTSVTTPQKEMPLYYTPNHNAIEWRYQTDWVLHDVHWGKNPDFNTPPQVTYSNCLTDQAVSFGVRNSKSLGQEPVYVDYNVNFKTYHELARAEIESENIIHKECGDHYQELVSHNYRFPMQQMPAVARYFKDYNPVCLYTQGAADGATGWAQLETMLLDNSYYATFDSNAEIRSVTEEGLNSVAEAAWRETMTSLIAGYTGIDTSYDYIIALGYDIDKHLKVGLYIHDGTWEIIEDVDAKKAELIANNEAS